MAAIETPIITMDSLETGYAPVLQKVDFRARIISISECLTDQMALRRMVDETKWQLTLASTCQEGLLKLRLLDAIVVFSDCTLPDGTWRDVLDMITDLEEPPLLIVTSRLADERLWSEVLNLGGYDVLQKPFAEDEVERVLASVWRQRHRHTQALPAAS